MYDVVIAGAGVIGSMIARELTKYELTVCVLEKENDVSCGASKANSGIIHGGFDPEPDTLKAKLNVEGVEKLFDAAKQLNVSIIRNGSFVCAFSEDEEEHIKALYERGIKNGVKGMEILNGEQARKIEPNLSKNITLVLSVSTAGIICPYELTIAAIGNAMDNGAVLKTNFEINKIRIIKDLFSVYSNDGDNVKAKYFINCAGTYSDKIAGLIGDNSFEIICRAGEYMLLDKCEGGLISHTVFQVPSKEGKGILVTPTVDGNLLVGPTASLVETPDNKETTALGLEKVRNLAGRSVENINFRNVITSFAGVRSSEKNGDFIIEESKAGNNFFNVAAIDSPGLSSCVAIAEYTVSLLRRKGMCLVSNKNWNGNREDPHKFKKLSDDEKNKFISKNSDYGKIICRCENITEGEIRAAIKRNPPAKDLDGVKRRTRSGMGRCQGGFCGPAVMRIISEEMGIPMSEITKKGNKSKMISGRL
ncbi:MAG: FAD-dependent oxidoreductase [Clostridia bacterium]|nr:FAD-dependent oxidoreductase [Clostridia bacterium]